MRTCTLRFGITAALSLALSACAAGRAESPAWNELEAVHATPAVREAATLAPVPFAAAERARLAAEHVCDSGHDAACDAAVDQALAGYALTEATARGIRAKTRAEAARASLTEQGRAADEAAAARTTSEREASELGAELEVATHVVPPRASGPAPAAREEARRRAAASLAEDAELLCDAARLAGGSAATAANASSTTDDPALLKVRDELKAKPAAGSAGPLLDDATRARAACLTQLTTVRARGTAIDSEAEAILAAVSARGLGDDATVHRDERGVLVVLAAPFDKDHLTTRASDALEALAAIALAHPKSALQLVAHDASSGAAVETDEHRALVDKRLDDAAHVLEAAGIPATRRHAVRAYGRLPIVDPTDSAHRARNERLEVVFVSH